MDHVLDASALVKRFLEGPSYEGFRAWDRAAAEEGAIRGAPTLLGFEVGNVIAREVPEGDPDEQALHLNDALRGVRLVEPDLETVFLLADDLTFYDAAYVALAKGQDASLVTYDEALVDAAGRHGVEVRSP